MLQRRPLDDFLHRPADGDGLFQIENLNLAISNSKTRFYLDDAIQLIVTKDEILFNGEEITGLDATENVGLGQGEDMTLEPLLVALKKAKTRMKGRETVFGSKAEPAIPLVADKSLRMGLLQRVLFTAKRAGFPYVRLVLRGPDVFRHGGKRCPGVVRISATIGL
jgi:hypothetical protein